MAVSAALVNRNGGFDLKKLRAMENDLLGLDSKFRTPFIKTPLADIIFGSLIIANAIFMGVVIDFTDQETPPLWVWVAESAFLGVFIIELLMRIWAERADIWQYFDRWGVFDLAVTIFSILDTWILQVVNEEGQTGFESVKVLRMLRLIRLVRLVRLLRMFNELAILLTTIIRSMKAVGWLSLLLGLVLYVGAIFMVIMLGQPNKDDPEVAEYFGTFSRCLYTHFQIATLENWGGVAVVSLKYHWLWGVYFTFFIILTNFVITNLMVGVIVERIIHVAVEQDQSMTAFVAESEQFRATMQAMFGQADVDCSGSISREEIIQLLDNPKTSEIMNAFSINLNVPTEILHRIMGVTGDGSVSFEEFMDACIRLCGSKGNVHGVFVQNDLSDTRHMIDQCISKTEEMIFGPQAPPIRATEEAAKTPYMRPADVKGQLKEMMDRMDRMTQVQQQIHKQVGVLRGGYDAEHVEPKTEGLPASKGLPVRSADVEDKLTPGHAVVLVLDKAGMEIGNCCVDTFFARRVGRNGAERRARSEGPKMMRHAASSAQDGPPWL